MKLTEAILNEMGNVSKPQKKNFIALIKAMISMYGKANFRSLSRYSGITEKTFRRLFKKIFDFAHFNSIAIDKVVSNESNLIAAFDPTFESKAGKKTWGRDYFWNGCAAKAEKGLEFAVCAIVDVAQNTAYTLAAEQTPASDSPGSKRTSKKADDYSRIDFYLSCIERLCHMILGYTRYIVFDGYFAKKKFVDGIVAMTFYFIGKLRCDANLKILYTGEQKKGRGRRKKFSGKCNLSELQGFVFEGYVDDKTKLYSGIFYHASLERKIRVVAVRYTQKGKVGTALLFSTDLDLAAFKIFRYYKARFQIEFLFRDAKQHVGLGDCQSRNRESLHFHFNASLAALNLVKIQANFDNQKPEKNIPFSMASYKVRFHNESVIDRIFSKLVPHVTLEKSSPTFREVVNFGAIDFKGR